MRNKRKIALLGEMLDGLAATRDWRSRLAQHEVFLAWPEVVGEELAAVCRPEVIRDSVLWVRVTDQVWGQQLQFEKTALLEAVNGYLQTERKITGLRVRFDPALAHELIQAREPEPAPEPPARTPEPAREAEFTKMIAGVNDPQAQANLLRLWRKAHR